MITNLTAFSTNSDYKEAFLEVQREIDKKGVPIFITFCSALAGFKHFTDSFHEKYPDATVIGTTTFYSFSDKGYGIGSLSVLAIFDGVECSSGTLFEITHFPLKYAPSIDAALEDLGSLDNTVCLEYSTAFGNSEELVQDTFKSVLEKKNIPVIGGTAGEKDLETPTKVSLNGTVYDEATVFAFIRNLNGKVFCYKENIYRPTKNVFMATDVDCEERIVYEFDGRPAVDVMKMALEATDEDIWAKLAEHPLGRVTGNEIYITDANRFLPDGSISYFARIYNMTNLVLLEPDDVEKVWRETEGIVKSNVKNPSFVLSINCYARLRYLESLGKAGVFSNFVAGAYGSFYGMTGFGEQFNYEHFNQTMVIMAFE